MFTGIIQGQAIINNKTSNFSEITFETNLNLSDCKKGSSINCDGICLTTTSIRFENNKYLFTANIGEETLKRSNTKFWNNNLRATFVRLFYNFDNYWYYISSTLNFNYIADTNIFVFNFIKIM